jgi:predicted GIY-YIG superfamily endonuclease
MEDDGFVEVSDLLSVAVYALVHKGKVVYIGQSAMPLVRIFQHKLKAGERIYYRRHVRGVERFPFDQIYIRTCTPRQVDALEREMVVKYQPKHNIALKFEKVDFKALVRSMVPKMDANVHPVIGKIERRI